jgi:hypothetical protein
MRLDVFRWYGLRLKIFLDWSFSFFMARIYSFLDFGWFVGFGPISGGGVGIMSRSGGSQYQIDIFGQI